MIHGWVFAFRYVRYDCVMYGVCEVEPTVFADRENDLTYITIFQRHFKWPCNKHLRKITLNYV